MKKLFLENFKCAREHDGDHSDSPYFLFFTGRRKSPGDANVHPVYLKSFNDKVFASGSPFTVHKEVASSVDQDTIVLVALLERDSGIDIEGSGLNNVRTWMRNKFVDYAKSGQFPTDDSLAKRMRSELFKTINANLGEDDDNIINIARLRIPSAGQPPPLTLEQPGDAKYTATILLS
jgi:hypothetical protein